MFVNGVAIPNNVVAGRTATRLRNTLESARVHLDDECRKDRKQPHVHTKACRGRIKAVAAVAAYRTAKPRLKWASFASQLRTEYVAAEIEQALGDE